MQAILNITDGEFGAVLTMGSTGYHASMSIVQLHCKVQEYTVLEARVILVCWCECVKVKVN